MITKQQLEWLVQEIEELKYETQLLSEIAAKIISDAAKPNKKKGTIIKNWNSPASTVLGKG